MAQASGTYNRVMLVSKSDTVNFDGSTDAANAATKAIPADAIAVDTAGLYKVDLLITDQLGKTTKQSLFVKSLANKAPVASLSVTLIDSSQINNWTYNLDASTSKKSDGSIISFIYNINGQAITSSKNAIRWTFHERGWQRISLFVTDDLKRASDSTIQKLFIQ